MLIWVVIRIILFGRLVGDENSVVVKYWFVLGFGNFDFVLFVIVMFVVVGEIVLLSVVRVLFVNWYVVMWMFFG